MSFHNIAKQKADLLEKQALLLLPCDKQNVQPGKRILSVSQWFMNQIQINMLQTDNVSSAIILAQKWPFSLLQSSRPIIYVFMAENDTLSKSKSLKDEKAPKNLLNLMLLFKTQVKELPLLSMLLANSLLQSLREKVQFYEPLLKLQIRWKHDILLDEMKVGQLSFKHVKIGDQCYCQASIEVNVKNIPKNFGAYDFQPTFLQKHTKKSINIKQLSQTIVNNIIKDIWEEETICERSEKVRNRYESQLIYLNKRVTIYDRKYEHIRYSRKFMGVDNEGNALLEGYAKGFEDGVMRYDSEAKDYLSLYRGSY